MIYVSWNTGCHRQKFSIFWANFVLSAPGNLENQNFNIEKNTWRHYHFTHLHHKWQSYDVWFLRYGARQTYFFVILDSFLLFYPTMDPENQNFQQKKKNKKNLKILFYKKKWQSYNVWFLKYGVQRTELFVILGHFLPFYPPTTQKTKFLKK